MNIELSKLNLNASLQSRDEMSQETIDDYADHMIEGVTFPPVLVYFDSTTHWLVDGYHRYFAYKKAGIEDIPADIQPGTFRDAELRSVSVNDKHGKQRTNQDKRKAVMKLLTDFEWSEWSDREVAKECRVSHVFVGRIKKLMDLKTEEKTYTNKHGTTATMNTAKIGKTNNKVAPAEAPPAPDDKMKEQLHELSVAHETLAEENAELKDRMAIGVMDATPEEKEAAAQTLQELRAIVKMLEAENYALKSSRDSLQAKNAELIKSVGYWKNRAEKAEKIAA